MKTTLVSDPKRIFGLDIIRAVAIMTVVIGHGQYMRSETFLQGFPYVRLLNRVELFFVLSSFLIGKMWQNILRFMIWEINGKHCSGIKL